MKSIRSWRRGQQFGVRELDQLSGFFRHPGDNGRNILFGGYPYRKISSSGKTERSRCDELCPLCHGSEPGCFPGIRRDRNMRRYEASKRFAEQTLLEENREGLSRLELYRNMSFFYYLRKFSQTRIFERFRYCLNFSKENFVCKAYYPIKYIAFQNTLSGRGYLTYWREPISIVLSSRKMQKFLCISGMSIQCAKNLLKANPDPRVNKFLLNQILTRFFGSSSIRKIIGDELLKLYDSNLRY
jgi:hypothetical protein